MQELVSYIALGVASAREVAICMVISAQVIGYTTRKPNSLLALT